MLHADNNGFKKKLKKKERKEQEARFDSEIINRSKRTHLEIVQQYKTLSVNFPN